MSYKVTTLINALNEKGIHVIADRAFTEIVFEFSEHDKKVAEEKDKKIAELTEELWKINEDFKKTASKKSVLQAENDQLYERISDLEFGDNSKIKELEKENNSLKEKLSFIRTRVTEEARDFWDKDMFGSLIITIPRKSNDNAIIEKMEEDLNRLTMDLKNRMGQIHELQEENKMLKEEKDKLAEMINDLLEDDTSELEEKLKNACGENQQLKITVDVLSKRIAELMEVHQF